jgi:hypothetical protein
MQPDIALAALLLLGACKNGYVRRLMEVGLARICLPSASPAVAGKSTIKILAGFRQ